MVINLVIIGVLLIGIAICNMLYTIIMRATAFRIKATVIRKIRRGNGYIPVVQITTPVYTQQMECNETCKCNQYMEGEDIEVYFNPANKQKVYIVGNYTSFVTDVLLIGVGVFAIFLGTHM